MKKLLLALVFVSAAVPASAAEPFREANAKYQSGGFEDAAALYEKAAAAKPSAAAYYNLGNARFRAGQKGKAVAAYERALRIAPRDKNTQWNLALAKSAIGQDAPMSGERDFLKEHFEHLLALPSDDEAAKAFAAAAFLFLLAAFARFFNLRASMFLLILSAALCLFTGAFLGYRWHERRQPVAVVTDKKVQARYGPSAKETAAFTLSEGAEVRVLDETGDWYFVSGPAGGTGWVPKSSAEEI
jgi:tetratricopeptide (TPR) repeat protein